jgi:hypothetical protein
VKQQWVQKMSIECTPTDGAQVRALQRHAPRALQLSRLSLSPPRAEDARAIARFRIPSLIVAYNSTAIQA